MPEVLLKIVVNEQQYDHRNAVCGKILSRLLEQGAPGATMRRGEAGLNQEGDLTYDLLEDSYFNDLPVIIESVMKKADAKKMEEGLKGMITHGQISIIEGADQCLSGNHTHYIVKVYTRESSRLIKKDEYEKILQLLRKHRAIWATVTKAVAGYGKDGVIYGRHVFSPSEHLPLVIECIAERECIPPLLDELRSVVTEGAVFTAPVELVLNQ